MYCHPAYLTYMQRRNAGLDQSPAGIKIASRNISIVRYADDTTLMAESKEELLMKEPLMKVKEESENVGLKLNNQKTKVMTSRQRDG